MADVFVSHAGADTATALEVGNWLRDEGHKIFLDRDRADGLTIGEDWANRLERELQASDAVVCLLSAAYVRSVWCTAEVAIASSHGSKVLPLALADGVDHPLLRRPHHIPYWSDPAAARAALRGKLREIDGLGRRSLGRGRSAFPGLVAFTVDDHAAFFGRERDIRRLRDRIRSAPHAATAVSLVVGPSGCGKSSLVNAGLVPEFRDDDHWWALTPFTPGRDPLSALIQVLAEAGDRVGRRWSADDVRTRLTNGRLADLATDLLTAAPGPDRRRLLMVVDQFEELVTLTGDAARRAFVDAVLARTAGGAVQVVGTLRPEFLGTVQADPAFAGITNSVELVGPLAADALPNVIRQPARLAGIAIEDGLVARIVEDTGDGEALPLLAYTLSVLTRDIGRGDTLTHAGYEQVGCVRGALVAQADEALTEAVTLTGRAEHEVLRGLLRLVTVDGQGRPTRLRVPTAALSAATRTELDAFVARRILIIGDEGRVPTIGVAHEAVLTAWQPLAGAIEADGTALRAQAVIDEATHAWTAAGRPTARLWEGRQLATALHDVGAPSRGPMRSESVELSLTAAEFLRQSVWRDRLRRGRTSLVLATLLVLALIGGVIAVVQAVRARDQSKLTLAHQLVAQADAARGNDDRAALQLGIAAQWVRPDETTAASLVQTVAATRYRSTLTVPSGASATAFARSGKLLATGTVSGTVLLWNTTDPRRPVLLGAPLDAGTGQVYSVAFSRDGTTLAVAGGNDAVGKAALWDVSVPTEPRRLPDLTGHRGIVHAARFSPDDRTLVTVGFDHRVLLWDVTDPAHPAPIGSPLTGHTDRVTTAAFAPDGRTLATGGRDNRILLWDVSERTRPVLLGPVPDGPTNAVWTLAWSGPTLAAASADGTVRLWDAADPKAPHRTGAAITVGTGQAYTVAFSPDGTRLATGGTDRVVAVWDVTHPGDPRPVAAMTGHADYVYTLAFRDNATLVSGSADGTAVAWDVSATPRAAAFAPPPGPDAEVYAAASTPDGRVVATGTADGRIVLSQPATGQVLGSVNAGSGVVRSLAVTRDGATLVVGGDAGVGLWDITAPTQPRRLTGVGPAGRRVYSVAVSHDGHTLAVGGDDSVVRLWDITAPTDPRPLAELSGHTAAVYAVRFSGTRVAAGGADNTVVLWNVDDPDRPMLLGGFGAPVYTVAFSPDGTTMLTGGGDGSVLLWTVDPTGQARKFGQQPTSHRAAVLTAAFTDDGRTVAAGYADGRVTLWDLTQPGYPRPFGPDLAVPTAVNALLFPPGPPALVTAARTTSVGRWDLAGPEALRADPAGKACALVGAGLDPNQWPTYLSSEPYVPTCRTP